MNIIKTTFGDSAFTFLKYNLKSKWYSSNLYSMNSVRAFYVLSLLTMIKGHEKLPVIEIQLNLKSKFLLWIFFYNLSIVLLKILKWLPCIIFP